MEEWLNGEEATLYIGLRADEDRAGARPTKTTQINYPLQECGITLSMVYAILDKENLSPPTFFWQRLYDAVKAELAVYHLDWTIDALPRFVKDRAFAWRSRPNCYFCFYQRQYEWVGLMEFYPDLFSEAQRLETGFQDDTADRREKQFNWISADMPLSRIRERAVEIFQKRVKALVKLLGARAQAQLFNETLLDELDMAQTSCGMFCGK